MPRISALDGLRGIAILLVVLKHLELVNWGWVGVDLFFGLSGYLITGILLKSKGQPNYWPRFVERRSKRIIPLYAAVLGVVAVVRWAGFDDTPAAPWWAYCGFVANVWMAVAGTYGTPLLMVTWSLCVEEQFYAVWPFVVRIVSRPGLVAVCVIGLIASPVLRAAMLHASGAVYLLTPCRLDGLMVGAIGALVAGTRLARPLGVMGVVGGAGVLVLLWLANYAALTTVVGYSALAWLCGGLVVLSAETNPRSLQWWPLVALGQASYGLYLLHYPAIHWLGPALGVPVAVLVAAASWRWLESPILHGHFRKKAPVLAHV